MEVQINKDIREYSEQIFMGLNMRQCIFGGLAVVIAAILYGVMNPVLGMDAASTLCILCAAPLAAVGFIRYQGMPLEQIIWAYIKTEMLLPREIGLQGSNIYLNIANETLKAEIKNIK